MRLASIHIKNHRVGLLLTLIISVFLFIGCSGDQEDSEEVSETPLKAVETVRLTQGRLIQSVSRSASLSGIREATLVSEAQGILQKVNFQLGDFVEAGDVIARIDDTIPRLNREQALQQLETARIEWNTQKQLAAQGSSSRAQAALAESNFRGAEARYETANKAYEDCALKAPLSGYIASLEADISEGNYLTRGRPVARIVDTSAFQVRISLGEDFVGLIKEGGSADISVPAACGSLIRQGTITGIAAGSDPSTGSYPVVITWDNECGPSVKSGMTAMVTIVPENEPRQLLIPTAALLERGGEPGVFLFDGDPENRKGTARFQPVEPGQTVGNRTAVNQGLSAGQEVIITGLTTMADGTGVQGTLKGESGSWD